MSSGINHERLVIGEMQMVSLSSRIHMCIVEVSDGWNAQLFTTAGAQVTHERVALFGWTRETRFEAIDVCMRYALRRLESDKQQGVV